MRWTRGTGASTELDWLKKLIAYRFDLPPLPETQLAPLFEMQWRAWRGAVLDRPGTDRWFLGEPARGAMLIEHRADETVLLELVVHPEERSQGHGGRAITCMKSHYEGPYRLSVRKKNPACRLYERHGFRLHEDRGTDLLLLCD